MLIPIRNDLPSSGIEVRCSALRPICQLFGSKERSEKKIGPLATSQNSKPTSSETLEAMRNPEDYRSPVVYDEVFEHISLPLEKRA